MGVAPAYFEKKSYQRNARKQVIATCNRQRCSVCSVILMRILDKSSMEVPPLSPGGGTYSILGFVQFAVVETYLAEVFISDHWRISRLSQVLRPSIPGLVLAQ